MHLLRLLLCGSLCLFSCSGLRAAESASPTDHDGPAAQLAEFVRTLVERDELVGAELLVVQGGRTLVHGAWGDADREPRRALREGDSFALRSMSKPLTGMAAQILINEDRLALEAPVARYLPAFDHAGSRAITIRQLLTHRAGFPLFSVMEKSLRGHPGGLRVIADRAGAEGPEHEPGRRFVYSDVGADVLGAVISAVSGQTLEAFIRRRILNPLRMVDTFPENEAGSDRRRDRVPARYTGGRGQWTPYWEVSHEPMYPFVKGAGGWYATAADYARLLQAWVHRERGAAGALLTPEAWARALAPTPGAAGALTTGFPGAVTDYGHMWTLYREAAAPGRVFGFGHSGSDGTHAYAFPERDLIVCLFTQSRGHEAAARFEAALAHLFLRPDPAAFASLLLPPTARELDAFTGWYAREGRPAELAAIMVVDRALAFQIPGRLFLRLSPTDDPDRWVPDRLPNDSVTFQREHDRVVGLVLRRQGRDEVATRFRPDPSLPTPEEILHLRQQAVPAGAWANLLPLRLDQRVEQNGATFPATLIVGADGRSRRQVDLGAAGWLRLWIDQERVWRQRPRAAVEEVEGSERSEEVDRSLPVALGDWRNHYREIVVLRRERFADQDVYRVGMVPNRGLAVTKLIGADRGVVLAELSFVTVPGAGRQGAEMTYHDFRDVGGLLLPHRQVLTLPGLGGLRVTVTTTGVDPRSALDPADLDPSATAAD